MKYLIPTLINGQPRLQPSPAMFGPLTIEDLTAIDNEISEAVAAVLKMKEMWDRAREVGEE